MRCYDIKIIAFYGQYYYYSKALALAQSNYSTYEEEMYGIVASYKHLRPYI